MDIFFQWLSAIPFAGGGFNDAAIAEGLAEALMMFSSPNGNQNQNVEGERHCILVAASNPYPLPTPVYRPQFPNNPEKTDSIETQPDNRLSDAETLAKSFAQGKRDPRAADPPVDNVKNPHFLVLISEKFIEAHSSLSRSGVTSLPSNQNPVKVDVTPVPPISGPPPASAPSANGSVLVRQPISVGNIHPGTVKPEPTALASVTGPAFPHISSVPRAASQAVPSLQTSSPMSTSQDMIANNENVPDMKPAVNNVTPSLRPVGGAAANVRILNDVAQARQALSGGTSIGLPSKTPILSNMISSGMTTSVSAAQTVISSGPPGVGPVAGSLPMSQPITNLQGSVGLVQTQMAQTGMSMNQNMMSGSGASVMPSQQGQPGMQPVGVNSNHSVSNMPSNQQTSSTIQSAQSKYIKVWEGNLSGQRQGQPVFITRLEVCVKTPA
ncbi:hypothetical protein DH2020_032530 [Rehmannia glutinosa]|uniref:Mediator of RNA polymerase II transcription subunit 25 n=1 Tax=Rehmannia glutinosa TaxID=99300 RepID=A0ABR0VHY9_REHGL